MTKLHLGDKVRWTYNGKTHYGFIVEIVPEGELPERIDRIQNTHRGVYRRTQESYVVMTHRRHGGEGRWPLLWPKDGSLTKVEWWGPITKRIA